MDRRRITGWTLPLGAVWRSGNRGSPCSGLVDAVTEDGAILRLQAPAQNRRLCSPEGNHRNGNNRNRRRKPLAAAGKRHAVEELHFIIMVR